MKRKRKEKIVTMKSKKKIKMFRFPDEIDHERCRYLKEEELPVMVLSVKRNYRLKRTREWKYMVHQTGGMACGQHYMRGTILTPKKKTREAMQTINDHWLDGDCGVFGVALDEVAKYRKQLKRLLDVDCNQSYRDFEEGIYPIDCTPENIRRLCKDKIPKDLDKFLQYKSHFGIIGRWHLYILGQNCD